jgi:methylenetetrahydrofolate dehydrogenase (NADP+)/methenyltetrahydrofolate cyclohydrolase
MPEYAQELMTIIDGKKIAADILGTLRTRPRTGQFFAAAVVGEDPASLHFLSQKEKTARELGIDFRIHQLPGGMATDALRREIGRLAAPSRCGAIIVQLPLPEHVNKHYALNAIPKWKDPDLLSEAALGAFYSGRHPIVPPSVGAMDHLLRLYCGDLRRVSVVVIGAGLLIGKPIGFFLQNRVAQLTIIDRSAPHLKEKLAEADVVVSGAGSPRLFNGADLKPGALVIDFGYGRDKDGVIRGDFDPAAAEATYTPTPGGTGPILVAKLFENFFALIAEQESARA